jgi:hypothetical protein
MFMYSIKEPLELGFPAKAMPDTGLLRMLSSPGGSPNSFASALCNAMLLVRPLTPEESQWSGLR